MPIRRACFWLVAGLALLIASSRLLVWGAVEIAHSLGVSDSFWYKRHCCLDPCLKEARKLSLPGLLSILCSHCSIRFVQIIAYFLQQRTNSRELVAMPAAQSLIQIIGSVSHGLDLILHGHERCPTR